MSGRSGTQPPSNSPASSIRSVKMDDESASDHMLNEKVLFFVVLLILASVGMNDIQIALYHFLTSIIPLTIHALDVLGLQHLYTSNPHLDFYTISPVLSYLTTVPMPFVSATSMETPKWMEHWLWPTDNGFEPEDATLREWLAVLFTTIFISTAGRMVKWSWIQFCKDQAKPTPHFEYYQYQAAIGAFPMSPDSDVNEPKAETFTITVTPPHKRTRTTSEIKLCILEDGLFSQSGKSTRPSAKRASVSWADPVDNKADFLPKIPTLPEFVKQKMAKEGVEVKDFAPVGLGVEVHNPNPMMNLSKRGVAGAVLLSGLTASQSLPGGFEGLIEGPSASRDITFNANVDMDIAKSKIMGQRATQRYQKPAGARLTVEEAAASPRVSYPAFNPPTHTLAPPVSNFTRINTRPRRKSAGQYYAQSPSPLENPKRDSSSSENMAITNENTPTDSRGGIGGRSDGVDALMLALGRVERDHQALEEECAGMVLDSSTRNPRVGILVEEDVEERDEVLRSQKDDQASRGIGWEQDRVYGVLDASLLLEPSREFKKGLTKSFSDLGGQTKKKGMTKSFSDLLARVGSRRKR